MVPAKRLLIVLGILGLASFSLWAQGKGGPPAAPAVAPPAPAEGGGNSGQAVDPATYIIGVEDVLSIEVFKAPEVSRRVTVRSDGKITLPLLDDVQAEGLTPLQLKKQLTEAFSEQYVKPQVQVEVSEVRSKKYTMIGKIARPSAYPLVTPIKIFDAINLAGGFTDFANQKDIEVLRGNETLHFNYKDYWKSKNRDKLNFELKNGDTIRVK